MGSEDLELIGRLLARRAASLSHLKKYTAALQDYWTAAVAYRKCGRSEKADTLEMDIVTVQRLCDRM